MDNKDLPLTKNDQRPLSREEFARLEIGHTEIRPGLALALTLFFLAMIFVVPLGQHAIEFFHGQAGVRSSSVPQSWEIFTIARDAWEGVRKNKRAPRQVLAVNRDVTRRIKHYTDQLEEESWFNQRILPITQSVLSNLFGVGNEKVYLGRGDWLFYRPAIDYLTGDGFLNPARVAHAVTSDNAANPSRQADPLKAIVQFNDQLAALGTELILMPVPDKASLHAEHFPFRWRRTARLHNSSYDEFLRALKDRGIRVFDPTERLAAFAREHSRSAYLATDTHWSPAAMESVAAALATELRPFLPAAPKAAPFRRETATVRNLGDLGKMLKLPDSAAWPAQESMAIHPVRPAAGSAAQVIDPSAELLLLGDSFSNIYSLESMGWGASAGLAEHLAFALNRPVDALRRNDAGAYATREMLANEVARGCGRLAGKRVVVWQFAARELAYGDWKLIDLSPATPVGSPLCGAAGLRALTGAHARMVWVRALDPASMDPGARRAGFSLMGLDTEDGRGAREILRGPISSRKPLLTPDGRRVVFTDVPLGRIGVVDWDGSNLRYVGDGFAASVWADPKTGRTWVYAVAGPIQPIPFSGKPLFRFDLNRPEVRETVWDRTEVSVDNLDISPDGRRAFGQFPWPYVGVADLANATLERLGGGCWTSLAPDQSNVTWIFDGEHRNLIFKDATAGSTWTVPISQAPGVGGFEVYHPRWANHRRFFTLSGPYKEGKGTNRIGRAGREVEIYAGRFSPDLRRVERWAKITTDEGPDFFPDLWIDSSRPLAFNPNDVEAPNTNVISAVATGPIVVDARLSAVTHPPTLESIAPYRQALVVYAYEVVKVHAGSDPGKRILVQHWALRNGRTVVPGTRVGDTVRLALTPVDSHPELQGERVIKDMTDTGLPMFYEPPR